jgi:hypothetical protein
MTTATKFQDEPTLYWIRPGVYEPRLCTFGPEWYLNTNGQPFVGVQVDSIENARRFAEVIVVPVAQEA